MVFVKTSQFAKTRIRAGFSQRELARNTGLSSAYVSQLERGERTPSPGVARRLCAALTADFETLFEIGGDVVRAKEVTVNA